MFQGVDSESLEWVAMLAPVSYRRFLSYLTGWVSLIGWQATTASSAYLAGTILQSTIIMLDDGYSPKPYQAILIGWAVLAFAVIINTVGSKTLAHFEGLILILHILGFFGILIPLVYLAPHSDASILTTWVNSGGWSTQGLSFMIGLPSSIFALIGVDSCVHMAEEVKNASKVVPRAIQISVLLNGALGLAMLTAFLFCLGNLDDVLSSSATLGYPYLYVFLHGTGSPAGAATMAMIMWVLGVCCLVGLMAATSRQMWSFARDRALPFSAQITKVYTVLQQIANHRLMLRLAPPSNPHPRQHDLHHGYHLRASIFHRAWLLRRFQKHPQSQYWRPLCLVLYCLPPASLATSPGYQPVQRTMCHGRTGDFTVGALESPGRTGCG
jgi:L-asparagine transporter-like permease